MGTWGASIFANDLAADVRAEWREAILDGNEAEDATARVEVAFADATVDPDESMVFWLALAAAQFETGRLLARLEIVPSRSLMLAQTSQGGRTNTARRRFGPPL